MRNAPRPLHRGLEAADDGAVDMDDRNDEPTPAAITATPLFSAGTKLPPAQQAFADYSEHAVRCDTCRDPDRVCETAGGLWRDYLAVANAAIDRLR